MNNAVMGKEQGLRVPGREALTWVSSGQGSIRFLGRNLRKGKEVRVRVFQATRMACGEELNKDQGVAV